jgi:hypothetical protein
MHRIKNTLVIPFWAQHFSTLRTDENVNAGFFRIGPRKDINFYAMELVSQLKDCIAKYEEGLLCTAQFINEAHYATEEAHDDAEYSKCAQRFSGCDSYACPAVKPFGSEMETKKMEKFVASYGK